VRDGGPCGERLHLPSLGRAEEGDAAAAAVAHQAEPGGVKGGIEPPCEDGVENRIEVVALDGERVLPEGVEVLDVAVRHPDAVSGEVEVNGREIRSGETLSEPRVEAPVLEALETVTDDGDGVRTVSFGPSEVPVNRLAQDALKREAAVDHRSILNPDGPDPVPGSQATGRKTRRSIPPPGSGSATAPRTPGVRMSNATGGPASNATSETGRRERFVRRSP